MTTRLNTGRESTDTASVSTCTGMPPNLEERIAAVVEHHFARLYQEGRLREEDPGCVGDRQNESPASWTACLRHCVADLSHTVREAFSPPQRPRNEECYNAWEPINQESTRNIEKEKLYEELWQVVEEAPSQSNTPPAPTHVMELPVNVREAVPFYPRSASAATERHSPPSWNVFRHLQDVIEEQRSSTASAPLTHPSIEDPSPSSSFPSSPYSNTTTEEETTLCTPDDHNDEMQPVLVHVTALRRSSSTSCQSSELSICADEIPPPSPEAVSPYEEEGHATEDLLPRVASSLSSSLPSCSLSQATSEEEPTPFPLSQSPELDTREETGRSPSLGCTPRAIQRVHEVAQSHLEQEIRIHNLACNSVKDLLRVTTEVQDQHLWTMSQDVAEQFVSTHLFQWAQQVGRQDPVGQSALEKAACNFLQGLFHAYRASWEQSTLYPQGGQHAWQSPLFGVAIEKCCELIKKGAGRNTQKMREASAGAHHLLQAFCHAGLEVLSAPRYDVGVLEMNQPLLHLAQSSTTRSLVCWLQEQIIPLLRARVNPCHLSSQRATAGCSQRELTSAYGWSVEQAQRFKALLHMLGKEWDPSWPEVICTALQHPLAQGIPLLLSEHRWLQRLPGGVLPQALEQVMSRLDEVETHLTPAQWTSLLALDNSLGEALTPELRERALTSVLEALSTGRAREVGPCSLHPDLSSALLSSLALECGAQTSTLEAVWCSAWGEHLQKPDSWSAAWSRAPLPTLQLALRLWLLHEEAEKGPTGSISCDCRPTLRGVLEQEACSLLHLTEHQEAVEGLLEDWISSGGSLDPIRALCAGWKSVQLSKDQAKRLYTWLITLTKEQELASEAVSGHPVFLATQLAADLSLVSPQQSSEIWQEHPGGRTLLNVLVQRNAALAEGCRLQPHAEEDPVSTFCELCTEVYAQTPAAHRAMLLLALTPTAVWLQELTEPKMFARRLACEPTSLQFWMDVQSCLSDKKDPRAAQSEEVLRELILRAFTEKGEAILPSLVAQRGDNLRWAMCAADALRPLLATGPDTCETAQRWVEELGGQQAERWRLLRGYPHLIAHEIWDLLSSEEGGPRSVELACKKFCASVQEAAVAHPEHLEQIWLDLARGALHPSDRHRINPTVWRFLALTPRLSPLRERSAWQSLCAEDPVMALSFSSALFAIRKADPSMSEKEGIALSCVMQEAFRLHTETHATQEPSLFPIFIRACAREQGHEQTGLSSLPMPQVRDFVDVISQGFQSESWTLPLAEKCFCAITLTPTITIPLALGLMRRHRTFLKHYLCTQESRDAASSANKREAARLLLEDTTWYAELDDDLQDHLLHRLVVFSESPTIGIQTPEALWAQWIFTALYQPVKDRTAQDDVPSYPIVAEDALTPDTWYVAPTFGEDVLKCDQELRIGLAATPRDCPFWQLIAQISLLYGIDFVACLQPECTLASLPDTLTIATKQLLAEEQNPNLGIIEQVRRALLAMLMYKGEECDHLNELLARVEASCEALEQGPPMECTTAAMMLPILSASLSELIRIAAPQGQLSWIPIVGRCVRLALDNSGHADERETVLVACLGYYTTLLETCATELKALRQSQWSRERSSMLYEWLSTTLYSLITPYNFVLVKENLGPAYTQLLSELCAILRMHLAQSRAAGAESVQARQHCEELLQCKQVLFRVGTLALDLLPLGLDELLHQQGLALGNASDEIRHAQTMLLEIMLSDITLAWTQRLLTAPQNAFAEIMLPAQSWQHLPRLDTWAESVYVSEEARCAAAQETNVLRDIPANEIWPSFWLLPSEELAWALGSIASAAKPTLTPALLSLLEMTLEMLIRRPNIGDQLTAQSGLYHPRMPGALGQAVVEGYEAALSTLNLPCDIATSSMERIVLASLEAALITAPLLARFGEGSAFRRLMESLLRTHAAAGFDMDATPPMQLLLELTAWMTQARPKALPYAELSSALQEKIRPFIDAHTQSGEWQGCSVAAWHEWIQGEQKDRGRYSLELLMMALVDPCDLIPDDSHLLLEEHELPEEILHSTLQAWAQLCVEGRKIQLPSPFVHPFERDPVRRAAWMAQALFALPAEQREGPAGHLLTDWMLSDLIHLGSAEDFCGWEHTVGATALPLYHKVAADRLRSKRTWMGDPDHTYKQLQYLADTLRKAPRSMAPPPPVTSSSRSRRRRNR